MDIEKIKIELDNSIFIPKSEKEWQQIWLILNSLYSRKTLKSDLFSQYGSIFIEDNAFHGTSKPNSYNHINKTIRTLDYLLELNL